MPSITEKFLRYVALDTQSADEADSIPSTGGQFALAKLLTSELIALGVADARTDEHCYVYGSIPATLENAPALGFIAHLDTSPEVSGRNVKARIVRYEGGELPLSDTSSISPERFSELNSYIGQELIVTDGSTLLGADDKAGVAEIMGLAEYLIAHPKLPHGRICIAFTPDEEVGCGADLFDIPGFGADFAYTVDGGALGEIEYENFNAADAKITIEGRSIHPGDAKDRMINAIHLGEELDALLPALHRPEHTEGYEGFFHLMQFEGSVSEAKLSYIIRDHDILRFESRKALLKKAADFIQSRYGVRVDVEMRDSYYNMKEKILPHMQLIEKAQAAFSALGITPKVLPIRGGTDGARLSFERLPCPNLSTGGHNFHGPYEYIPVQSLEKMCEVLVELVRQFYKS